MVVARRFYRHQVFNGAVCVDTTITNVQLQQGDCSPGWATISDNEISANRQKYCNMLGSGGVARTGFMGSLSANGCSQSGYDTSRITQSICVQREINDIELVRLKTNICGEGMVLVTQQEAQANQAAYCNLLRQWDILRLANGGSMEGSGYGCNIRYEDRRDLGGALCTALQNSEPNENENVSIPETTTISEATFNVEQPLNVESNVNSENTELFCCW
jgi:hypothetical protein